MFGISTGTISNIIKEYEDALAIVDLEPIRKNLKTIYKHGFTVKDCAEASQFLNLTKDCYRRDGIKYSTNSTEFFKEIVKNNTELYKFCAENGISPNAISSWIKDLQQSSPNLRDFLNSLAENMSIYQVALLLLRPFSLEN